ncbi:DUF2231 domain-containing protein [Arthrobacter koreensis]|uniref:DUF2231 domain-containing protein n=1 Tax=Arthrobacter koreensis TaxID=199136 RepID=UPI002DBF2629|nr:DUF2231 domain-containing protein [Arthrobacter koreensis]MEB7504136.1 hypothetical protein [Arthrobacter koreensis]
MNQPPASQQLIRTISDSAFAERAADLQSRFYKPILDWVPRTVLNRSLAGHSVHPILTDLPIGCWAAASIVDFSGGAGGRRSAGLLLAAGIAASIPTAFSGANDWKYLTGTDRRTGAVHALGTDIASFLMMGSLIARLRGKSNAGRGLAVAGNVVMAGAGFLGGYLALTRGAAHRD